MNNKPCMRFEVSSPKESIAIQKALFAKGYNWGTMYKRYIYGDIPVCIEYPFLYAHANGDIGYGDNDEKGLRNFHSHRYPKCSIHDI